MQILDDDGIAAPGELICNHDVYVNKQSPKITRDSIDHPMGSKDIEYRPTNAVFKGPESEKGSEGEKGPEGKKGLEGETTVIDRVILYSDTNNKLCIKVITRHTRRPEVGDKFSSRHGHKGVCGLIVQQEDFPFTERGICPDLIMNPHGFASFQVDCRMETRSCLPSAPTRT